MSAASVAGPSRRNFLALAGVAASAGVVAKAADASHPDALLLARI